MKAILGIALSLCVFSSVHAQAPDEPIVINGTCDPKSGVTIDNGDPSRFACDSAVIARTERGTVLIQFTDKSGDDGRILGFAGTIEGKQGFGADLMQMMAVERIYLASGDNPIPASAGTCIMNWTGLQRTGGRLTSILCGGRGQVENSDIRAMAVLQAQ
ncbi:hypothetical protein [Sphingobium sp. D43FB]|uniref:hypothetical protein n=1 Tax=Sphingobium sp. D43FB TaxID=2017595 RepID=UPI000BB561C5|nr:hypothetical protein [Sphingobium sp. D43FB]PBN43108.1 hypothetical protein SxD43FB_12535 [Sphingobium sp. D43FB]